jgi:hypothetical protein
MYLSSTHNARCNRTFPGPGLHDYRIQSPIYMGDWTRHILPVDQYIGQQEECVVGTGGGKGKGNSQWHQLWFVFQWWAHPTCDQGSLQNLEPFKCSTVQALSNSMSSSQRRLQRTSVNFNALWPCMQAATGLQERGSECNIHNF